METTGLFNKENTDLKFSQLCSITKDRIESFLPGLWEDLFKVSNNSSNKLKSETPIVAVKAPTEAVETVAESNGEAASLAKELVVDNVPVVSGGEKVQEVQDL